MDQETKKRIHRVMEAGHSVLVVGGKHPPVGAYRANALTEKEIRWLAKNGNMVWARKSDVEPSWADCFHTVVKA